MIDAESGAEIELIRPKAGDEKLHAQGGGAAANKIALSRAAAKRVFGCVREEQRGRRAAF